MKYIDADKLITEIERRIAQWQPYTFACASQIASEAFDRIDELKGLLVYITSLQQEQLVNKDLGTLITCDIIEMTAKKAIDKPQDKEKEVELMTRKINYLRSLEENYVQQEQPETELEKEIKRYQEHYILVKEKGFYLDWMDIETTARHFYELGCNTQYQKDRGEFAKLKMKEWQEGYDEGYAKGLNARNQPSLPSDLDEAAEKNFETMEVLEHENIFEETHRKIFKAGAEWMAGQGETVEGVFKAGDPGYPDIRMGEQYSIEHILRKPGGIEPGDEVLAQIRKK